MSGHPSSLFFHSSPSSTFASHWSTRFQQTQVTAWTLLAALQLWRNPQPAEAPGGGRWASVLFLEYSGSEFSWNAGVGWGEWVLSALSVFSLGCSDPQYIVKRTKLKWLNMFQQWKVEQKCLQYSVYLRAALDRTIDKYCCTTCVYRASRVTWDLVHGQ